MVYVPCTSLGGLEMFLQLFIYQPLRCNIGGLKEKRRRFFFMKRPLYRNAGLGITDFCEPRFGRVSSQKNQSFCRVAETVSALGDSHRSLVTRWATHGKRLKGLKVAGYVSPMLAHVGPMLALYWPNLALSCPYVGPMFAYMLAYLSLMFAEVSLMLA